jgi:hypothetical protein
MRAIVMLLALALAAGVASGQEKQDGWENLFNGKDLAGWKLPKDNAWWKVSDGVIVGESDEKLRGSMLYTEKAYKDVLIEAEFRFNGDIDSGIMLRRRKDNKGDIQVQIGVSRSLKVDMTGSIYAHGKYPGKAQGVDKLLKAGDWNTLRIEARGDTYKVFLNGTQVLTYQDPAFPNPGPIGLQVHGGVKMKIEFRNLRAKQL